MLQNILTRTPQRQPEKGGGGGVSGRQSGRRWGEGGGGKRGVEVEGREKWGKEVTRERRSLAAQE